MNQNPSLAERLRSEGRYFALEAAQHARDLNRSSSGKEQIARRRQALLLEAAERLEAGTWQPGREEVARIIEPSAFKRETRHHSRVYRNASLAEGRTDAFAKADKILALETPAPGGGER